MTKAAHHRCRQMYVKITERLSVIVDAVMKVSARRAVALSCTLVSLFLSRSFYKAKAANAATPITPIPAIWVAVAAKPSEVAVARTDVATADAEARSELEAPSSTSWQMSVAREVRLFLSSEVHELVMTQVAAPERKESLFSQMQEKSVTVQLALLAPSLRQSAAQVGNCATRSGREVEFWAAATAAKRGMARYEICILAVKMCCLYVLNCCIIGCGCGSR